MTTTDTATLLPCPFCGGVAGIDRRAKGIALVYCTTCLVGTECHAEKAIARWNARLTEGAGVAAGEPTDVDTALYLRDVFVETGGKFDGWIEVARAVLSGEWRKGGRP